MLFPLTKTALRGGKAEGQPDSAFNPKQLALGKKVEKEHTDKPDVAKQIAKDHLTEDKKYYPKLIRLVEHKDPEKLMQKKAGLESAGMAALLGLLVSTAARSIPAIDQTRVQNPGLYDAALSAAVLTIADQLRSGSGKEIRLPGQGSSMGPGWNLM